MSAATVNPSMSAVSFNPLARPSAQQERHQKCWNWNLCDAAYGALVLDIKEGFNPPPANKAAPAPEPEATTPNDGQEQKGQNLVARPWFPSGIRLVAIVELKASIRHINRCFATH
ncbi:hypothetical protein BDZ89DRAFT_1133666 [Hymenopellis radicata]|nr:hypothetical protein BDZ89DRAFT_1133666 [Hymenopellis radicata]